MTWVALLYSIVLAPAYGWVVMSELRDMAEDLGLRHRPGPGALGGPITTRGFSLHAGHHRHPLVFEATYDNFNRLRQRDGAIGLFGATAASVTAERCPPG